MLITQKKKSLKRVITLMTQEKKWIVFIQKFLTLQQKLLREHIQKKMF